GSWGVAVGWARASAGRCLLLLFCGFTGPPPAELYTLSLHDALPISGRSRRGKRRRGDMRVLRVALAGCGVVGSSLLRLIEENEADRKSTRLNSSHVKMSYAVFRLKKKKSACADAPGARRATGHRGWS